MIFKFKTVFESMFKRYYENFFFKFFLHKMAKENLKNYYTKLTKNDLANSRKSETLIVMGSGCSINDLTKDEIQIFEKHDVFVFNGFLEFGDFIRVDYFLGREFLFYNNDLTMGEMENNGLFHHCFAHKVNDLKSRDNTIFFLQHELCADSVNFLLAHKMLPPLLKIFPFHNPIIRRLQLPWKNLKKILHCGGTLGDVVHVGYSMGYKRIVLVGVDLYDRNHFWMTQGETSKMDKQRGADCNQRHNMADSSINVFDKWNVFFKKEGVELFVYNPKSLLTEVLPTISPGEL